MNFDAVAIKLLIFGLGSLVSLVSAYVAISRDLSFQRGQLSQIMQQLGIVQKLQETLIALDKSHSKSQFDITQAHEKIRNLEGRGANGLAASTRGSSD